MSRTAHMCDIDPNKLHVTFSVTEANITNLELFQYFANIGSVVNVYAPDRNPNTPTRFAIITFKNSAHVEKVVSTQPHIVNGQMLEIRLFEIKNLTNKQ